MGGFLGISGSEKWLRTELVDKGWSKDTKYHVWAGDGSQLLLRVSDISMLDRKNREYEVMRMLDNCDILMSRPVDFGACDDGRRIFILLTWLDGEEANDVLPTLSAKEQYDLGLSAGRALRKIHAIPAPTDLEEWATRFNRKIDRNIRMHAECELKIEGADRAISFINENRPLLSDRPQTFQHGDYHVGNMVITPERRIGVIDFDRFDYGDPWEEFNRICWCARVSGHFASGRINGYFDGDVPEEFFRLMALYIASNMLSTMPWAIPFGDAEIRTAQALVCSILDWYDGFRTYMPKWYMSTCGG